MPAIGGETGKSVNAPASKSSSGGGFPGWAHFVPIDAPQSHGADADAAALTDAERGSTGST